MGIGNRLILSWLSVGIIHHVSLCPFVGFSILVLLVVLRLMRHPCISGLRIKDNTMRCMQYRLEGMRLSQRLGTHSDVSLLLRKFMKFARPCVLPSISSGCSVETWNRRHEVGIFVLPDCGVTCKSYIINNKIQTSPPTPSWTTSRRRPAQAICLGLARPSSSAHEERGQLRRLSMAPAETTVHGAIHCCRSSHHNTRASKARLARHGLLSVGGRDVAST